MNFPLNFRFKLFAIAPQIFVTDATGATVFYIKEKLFKLKETINIFSDESQSQQVATIQADRLMNWSARFNITDAHGQPLGSIGRQGFRSLWRAHYDLFDAKGDPAGKVSEENPFAKVFDYLLARSPHRRAARRVRLSTALPPHRARWLAGAAPAQARLAHGSPVRGRAARADESRGDESRRAFAPHARHAGAPSEIAPPCATLARRLAKTV